LGERVTDTYDFVVVGGGSGGCAAAGRLSEDSKTSVALLEAGKSERQLGGHYARRAGADGARQAQQLGV